MSKPSTDLNQLHPLFAYQLGKLVVQLQTLNLPFTLFETIRTKERQDYLKQKGYSRALFGQSPHNHGLAADFVLDIPDVNPWNYKRKEWTYFGSLIDQLELDWGGNWVNFKDYPHVQLKEWRKYRRRDGA